jgi:hypothetical protein
VTKSVRIGREVRQGCCLSLLLLKLYSEYVIQEALEGFGDFKVEGQIFYTVRYGDDLVLLTKEKTILQSIIDNLIKVERGYGIEIKVENIKTMRISRQPTPVQIMIDKNPWRMWKGSTIWVT